MFTFLLGRLVLCPLDLNLTRSPVLPPQTLDPENRPLWSVTGLTIAGDLIWLELRRLPQILVYCHGELKNP